MSGGVRMYPKITAIGLSGALGGVLSIGVAAPAAAASPAAPPERRSLRAACEPASGSLFVAAVHSGPSGSVVAFRGAGADVEALALRAEQVEDLRGPRTRVGDAVREAGVELGDLSRAQYEVVFAEQQAYAAGQDVQPLVAFVGLLSHLAGGRVRREDLLGRLPRDGPAGARG